MKSLVVISLGTLLALGCNKSQKLEKEEGVAPPPKPSAAVGACKGGGGKPTDAPSAAFFPRQVEGYCIDPSGEVRAYGKESKNPIDDVCLEQFNGECEVYKGYGLDRVVTLRYVDGKGTTGEVSVTLARFATRDGSYGFFTRRVVAGQDPKELSAKPLDAGGQAALGTGIAYVWRGLYVVQLAYTNTEESPKELAASSAKVLPPVAQEIGKRVTGELGLPHSAAGLPEAQRFPLGIEHAFDDVLGVKGSGSGAVGYYSDSGRRWRAVSIVRPDADSAGDIVKTFRRLDGAKKIKGLPFEAIRFTIQDDDASPRTEWVLSQKGQRVIGIGDDPYAGRDNPDPDALAQVRLSEREKLKRLQEWLQASSRSPSDTAR